MAIQILPPQRSAGGEAGEAFSSGFIPAFQQSLENRTLREALSGLDPQAPLEDQSKVISGLNVSPEKKQQALHGLEALATLRERQARPAGGLTGQPVPQEISQGISQVIQENPEASADELALKLDSMNIPRAFSNSFIENRRRQDERAEQTREKRFESERAYQSKRAMPYLTKLDESRESIGQKDQALQLMDNAISEQDLSFFSKDNLANFLGQYGEGLRTAKGAQLINAQKEFLLGNIGRAGARPNMYIEKQIASMLAKTGRSKEANQTVVESLRSEQDISKKKMELADELVERYEKELGYVPGNIASQVDKMVKPYAQATQDRLAYRLRNIQENETGEKSLKNNINKRVTRGTPLTLQSAKLLMEREGSKEGAMKKAKALGYQIPTIEQYREYL